MTEVYAPGLEGVLAGETAISALAGGLSYRGYLVTELAEQTSFEEVAYLLLYGALPTAAQLAAFRQRLVAARTLPPALPALWQALPADTPPMDALRTTVSILAHFDPEAADASAAATQRKAERLLAQLPLAIADFYHLKKGEPAVPPRPELGHAAHFLYLLRGREATPAEERAFEVSLILYAEHEFNASTFTVRVICSTESDLYSAIVGGLGALKGRLHGGANEHVMDLLRQVGSPENAERWIKEALSRKERIMGFGHRVYKSGDVRAQLLKKYAQQLAAHAGLTHWEKTAEAIEQVLEREKGLYPNLDWPAGRLYYALGLEAPLYTPIFAAARVAGWAAHYLEQASHNRLIRPRARYIGPELRPVPPLAARK